MEQLIQLWQDSGIYQMQPGQVIMILIGLGLLYLAINKKFEPLLLVPIGFGGILANIPGADLALTSIEKLIAHGDAATLASLADLLGRSSTDVYELKAAPLRRRLLLFSLRLFIWPLMRVTAMAC